MKRIVIFIFLCSKYLLLLAQSTLDNVNISVPRIVRIDNRQKGIDKHFNGMSIRVSEWTIDYGHTPLLLGHSTHMGAYIKGIREGMWLIYHDSMLFAKLNYLNGYVDGECIFYITNDDFYEIRERERVPNDSAYEDDVFWEVHISKPMVVQYILKLHFEKGNANGIGQIYLPSNEKIMEFECKNDELLKINYIDKSKCSFFMVDNKIPFEEEYSNNTWLKWIESHKLK